jgi:hypothetical protein
MKVCFLAIAARMRRAPCVFNTDQVNRDLIRFPASVLMKAEQDHHRECLNRGVGVGMPSCIQHDMHRPVGWSRPIGLYADGNMVRHVGFFEEPESEEEKADLEKRAAQYWEEFHREGSAPYRDELISRIPPADLGDARLLQIEAVAVQRSNIAAELYPELFTPGLGCADKDGLVDYRDLLKRMPQVQPGLFHDPRRDLLLFAHRFFRRSLSHGNKLNAYFLQSFDATANENPDLQVRLRLDPDLVGHPASARNLIELEYWRGPLYSDDISNIPNGVAEHKADKPTRFYEGIDRTQVWWKAPEVRSVDGQSTSYRTFEIEELIENPSGGLGDVQFGCRYAHAEFSADEAAITHFDGAVRSYAWEPYLQRIEASLDRAGKHANYVKLFRFDRILAIPNWKRVLSDFFRGNKLIPEYLGAPAEAADEQPPVPTPSEGVPLAALVSVRQGSVDAPMRLCSEKYVEIAGYIVPYIEIGMGEVEGFIRSRLDLTDLVTVGFKDHILNLSRLSLGISVDLKGSLDEEVRALACALRHDAERGLVHRAAVPLMWADDGLLVTLTIAGDADKVATVMHQLPDVVDPRHSPSEWIESLSQLIKSTAPGRPPSVIWDGMERGVLEIGRSGTVEGQYLIPDSQMQVLLASGKLNVRTTEGGALNIGSGPARGAVEK